MLSPYLCSKINEMKTILSIFSLLSSIASLYGQEEKEPSHFLANLNVQMVYRGISNYYEYAVCDDCDTVYVTAIGAEILNQSTYSFELVPLPGQRDISVSTNCVQGNGKLTKRSTLISFILKSQNATKKSK
jgi:hypothetical protein